MHLDERQAAVDVERRGFFKENLVQ